MSWPSGRGTGRTRRRSTSAGRTSGSRDTWRARSAPDAPRPPRRSRSAARRPEWRRRLSADALAATGGFALAAEARLVGGGRRDGGVAARREDRDREGDEAGLEHER